ncbi:MAG: hypothetical protein JXR85_11830 [Deltaproteobacteria bacterium]|nr:hypothetical protein [Deltaproteobacteria bacterium]
MTLVRIVKDWDWPDLLRQTPGGKGIWQEITFTLDPVGECDYLLMLNNRMKEEVTIKCPRENVWALMQEPYLRGHSDWLVEGHDSFSRVFTHIRPYDDDKYVTSHPAIPWFVNRTYDQLVSMDIPPKSKKLSWVVGNATDLPGHLKRLSFLHLLQEDASLEIDLFGRAVHYIEDKWDGLAPYRYSLAVENSNSPDYWTEKLADCFLAWSVPFYYGCANIEEYFPEESFIRIDIDQPKESMKRIKSVIEADDWEKRIPVIEEARNRVLQRYQFFPHVANLIQHSQPETSKMKETITIPPYRKSLAALFYRTVYKLKKKVRRL